MPSPRLLWAAVLLCCVAVPWWTAKFVRDTAPVRYANSDDAWLEGFGLGKGGAADPAQSLPQLARDQARFYFATPLFPIPLRIYRFAGPLAFAGARAAIYLGFLGLLGWTVSRLTGSGARGAAVSLMAAGALHLPAAFYPILSSPAILCGASLALVGAVAQAEYARQRRLWLGAVAGVAWLAAFMLNEVFCMLALLAGFLVLCGHRQVPSIRERLRRSLPTALALAAYVCVYLLFIRTYPSMYGGTVLTWNPLGSLDVLVREILSAVPPGELFLGRAKEAGMGPALRDGPQIAAILSTADLEAIALSALLPAAIVVLLRSAPAAPQRPRLELATAVAVAVLPLIPIALTPRYQEMVHQRMYPYFYSYFAYCAFAYAAVAGLERFLATGARWRALAAWAALFVLFISAQATTEHTLKLLSAWYN